MNACTGFLILIFGGFGITGGAHRLWSHRAYKAKWPLRLFVAVGQTMALQVRIFLAASAVKCNANFSEPCIQYSWFVRKIFTDGVGIIACITSTLKLMRIRLMLFAVSSFRISDGCCVENTSRSHDIALRLWWAIFRLILSLPSNKSESLYELSDYSIIKFLWRTPLTYFCMLYRFYIPLAILVGVVFPIIVPYNLWDESLRNCFFVPFLLRLMLSLNATWMVNSVAHTCQLGYRPYDRYNLNS